MFGLFARKWRVQTLCPGMDLVFAPDDLFRTRRAAVAYVRAQRMLSGRLWEYRLRNDRTGEEVTL